MTASAATPASSSTEAAAVSALAAPAPVAPIGRFTSRSKCSRVIRYASRCARRSTQPQPNTGRLRPASYASRFHSHDGHQAVASSWETVGVPQRGHPVAAEVVVTSVNLGGNRMPPDSDLSDDQPSSTASWR